MNYKKTTFKNGLRVLTVPMQGTQTAAVIIMVGVGSRFENEKEAGLSHFIEHMMFKGTEKRPNTKIISEELDAIGGEYNAFTAKDKTAYYAKVDSKHFATAVDVMCDIYLNSKIEQVEIDRERGTILQELSMYEDNPQRSVGDEFEKLLYKKDPMGRDVIGYAKTIKKVQRQDFLDYIKRFYHAGDTVVCVAGKFDEKKVLAQLAKHFEKFPKKGKKSLKKVEEKQVRPELHIKFKKTDQTHLICGVRAYHQNHKDRYALGLMAVILGGNMSSRMFLEIRERLGLAYFVHTSVDTYQDCGYLATQAGVEHGNLKKTVKEMLKQYKLIAEEVVDEKELQKAKDYIKGKAVMGFEASDDVAMFFIDQEMHKESILTPEQVFEKIDKVTTKDIQRVAKDIFQNKKLNLAIVGPHKNNAEIKKMLNI
jgi:predicted Zn-dependent peptidase